MSSTQASHVSALLDGLASGAVQVIDLTQPLSETTPVLQLPPPFANTPGLSREEISKYDDRGPAWAWYTLTIGEHVGTHTDAPIHWVTGRRRRRHRVDPGADAGGPGLRHREDGRDRGRRRRLPAHRGRPRGVGGRERAHPRRGRPFEWWPPPGAWSALPVLRRLTISPPPYRVLSTMASRRSLGMSFSTGIPPGVAVADEGHHRISVRAQHKGADILDGDAELHGNKGAKSTRPIEDARLPHHPVFGETALLERYIGHDVDGIAHDDKDRLRASGLRTCRTTPETIS